MPRLGSLSLVLLAVGLATPAASSHAQMMAGFFIGAPGCSNVDWTTPPDRSVGYVGNFPGMASLVPFVWDRACGAVTEPFVVASGAFHAELEPFRLAHSGHFSFRLADNAWFQSLLEVGASHRVTDGITVINGPGTGYVRVHFSVTSTASGSSPREPSLNLWVYVDGLPPSPFARRDGTGTLTVDIPFLSNRTREFRWELWSTLSFPELTLERGAAGSGQFSASASVTSVEVLDAQLRPVPGARAQSGNGDWYPGQGLEQPLSVTLHDANPTLSDPLPPRIGTTADGVSKLLIVVRTDRPVDLELAAGSAASGTLTRVDGGGASPLRGMVPVNGDVRAIYTPPEDPGTSQPTRTIVVIVSNAEDPSQSVLVPIVLQRAPLVMIHGLWSNASTWSAAFRAGLEASGYPPDLRAFADYSGNGGAAESWNPRHPNAPGLRALRRTIHQMRTRVRKRGIAITKVDLLGHSMGGLYARSFIQQSGAANAANFDTSDVRRFVTLGTPHYGAGVAAVLSRHARDPSIQCSLTRVCTIAEFFASLDDPRPIDRGAIDALAGGSSAYQALTAGTLGVPAHAFITDAANAEKMPLWLVIANALASPLNCGQPNDLVVTHRSQAGGIAADARSTGWNGITHLDQTDNGAIAMAVAAKLAEPLPTSFTTSFPAPGADDICDPEARAPVITRMTPTGQDAEPPSERRSHATPARPAPIHLTFAAPAANASIDLGVQTQVPIALTSPNVRLPIAIGYWIDGGDEQLTVTSQDPLAGGLLASVQLPADLAPGRHSLVAFGTDATGAWLTAMTTIVVSRSTPLVALTASPGEIWLDTASPSYRLLVTGTFSDGTEVDLTSTSTGTAYDLENLGTAAPLIAVDHDGRVSALATGDGTLVVRHGAMTATVTVHVSCPLAGCQPVRAYLAEGATGSFFETRFALFNASAASAIATARFSTDTGQAIVHHVELPPFARRTIIASAIPGLETANFSTLIQSSAPIVVERTMTWDASGYGSHAEAALPSPSSIWYLAEGSTSADFALFYLLHNPESAPVTATIRYLRALGMTPIERSYTLPAQSRVTIPVDGEGPELANTDVSAVITASAPIVVERAMYKSTPTESFAAGHTSAGVTAPATRWFLAEGATGPFFDLFILIANPSDAAARVRVDYLLSTGETFTKLYDVPANGRYTIWVDDEEIPIGAAIKPLVNVAVSSTITSTNGVPITVERTMWWPGPEVSTPFWTEAHNSVGATATATRWAVAEGEVGGPRNAETYLLIANTSAFAGQARVALFFEDGTSTEHVVPLLPTSRTNVNASEMFPDASGRRFAALVESLGALPDSPPAEIVVERAMYTSTNGQTWNAGTNALGTPVPAVTAGAATRPP